MFSDDTKCVLWDFGDTLADERLMWSSPDNAPEWTEIWKASEELDILNPWMEGKINLNVAAEMFAEHLPISSDEVIKHMQYRCKNISFFKEVMDFVKYCKLPQAIVTLNPDIFTDWIVPNYNLQSYFDPIVASWELKTLSKADLCDDALNKLKGQYERSSSLLIDNKLENVAEWQNRGGIAYHFIDEITFRKDFDKYY